MPRRSLSSPEAAATLFAAMAHAPRETCAVAYLDARAGLLGTRHCAFDRATAVDMPIRAIAIDVLVFGAASVIFAHNHPSGDPSPSDSDILATRRLVRALSALGVRLHDHLILSAGRTTSFHALGLL